MFACPSFSVFLLRDAVCLRGTGRVRGKQAVKVLLNSVPESVEFDGVLEELQRIEGVSDVHDLHIWGISSKTVGAHC